MNIGLICLVRKENGGIYQYAMALTESLCAFTDHNYFIIKNDDFDTPAVPKGNLLEIAVKTDSSALLTRVKRAIYINLPIARNFLDASSNYKFLKDYKLDIVISPLPTLLPVYLEIPYIVTIHDLQHKYYPGFFSLKERIKRNYYYSLAAKNAALIVCESSFVKDDIKKFLKTPEQKIRIITAPPPQNHVLGNIDSDRTREVKNKYNLPEKFLFYPAHFWQHKNHIRLIKAIELLKNKYQKQVFVIFAGTKQNNFDNTMDAIKKSNLRSQVRYLGYVPAQDLPYIYKNSTALVIPTLFESVSIPIWEAFYSGIPVISSNVCALPEQVANAGIMFNPLDIVDMAEKIYKIWLDETLRQELVKKGYERIKGLTSENYAKSWEGIIEEIAISQKGQTCVKT